MRTSMRIFSFTSAVMMMQNGLIRLDFLRSQISVRWIQPFLWRVIFAVDAATTQTQRRNPQTQGQIDVGAARRT